MKIWLITDTHFGHEKMREYCNRPIRFEDKIFSELEKIPDDDLLIHLGDICIGKDEYWHTVLAELPFKKWLIRGNHDSKSLSWYLGHGWDYVGDEIKLTFEGKKLLLSHTPLPIGDDYDLMIHGHFHNTLHRLLEKQWISPDEEKRNKKDLGCLTPKHKLLAIEYTNYKPVLLSTFIQTAQIKEVCFTSQAHSAKIW